MRTFNDMLEEQLKDDEFRKEYESIQPDMDVIRAIVNARASQNLTQKELADAAGMSKFGDRTIRRWEAEETVPSVLEFKAIMDFPETIPFPNNENAVCQSSHSIKSLIMISLISRFFNDFSAYSLICSFVP